MVGGDIAANKIDIVYVDDPNVVRRMYASDYTADNGAREIDEAIRKANEENVGN